MFCMASISIFVQNCMGQAWPVVIFEGSKRQPTYAMPKARFRPWPKQFHAAHDQRCCKRRIPEIGALSRSRTRSVFRGWEFRMQPTKRSGEASVMHDRGRFGWPLSGVGWSNRKPSLVVLPHIEYIPPQITVFRFVRSDATERLLWPRSCS